MCLFTATGVSEHTGHGVPLIVSRCGREVYEVTGGTVKVVLPFSYVPDSPSGGRRVLGEVDRRGEGRPEQVEGEP